MSPESACPEEHTWRNTMYECYGISQLLEKTNEQTDRKGISGGKVNQEAKSTDMYDK